MSDRKTNSRQGDAVEYETIKVDSRVVTDLKAYLLMSVLPFLTDLPEYEDSEEFKDGVLSIWVGEAIKQGIERDTSSAKQDRKPPSRDEIGNEFGEVAIKC